jgi:probable HAF family extracellular repeat protein
MRQSLVGTTSALLILLAAASTSAQTYHLTDLGTLPGGGTIGAAGINNAGKIVGFSEINSGSASHAFLYSNGMLKDIGNLGGTFGEAHKINARGDIVGDSYTKGDTASHAFLYSGGKIKDLGTLGGLNSTAQDINARGQIVGWSDQGLDNPRAFVYTPPSATPTPAPRHWFLTQLGKHVTNSGRGGAMRDLGTLGGDSSFATGINDSGQIVGAADVTNDFGEHAFLYSGGKMHDLGTLPGGNLSFAEDINARGQIVGRAAIRGFDESSSHAFLYAGGTMHDLGTLGGTYSDALAINVHGQVVGLAATNGGSPLSPHAFIDNGAGLMDLNSLIDGSGTGWTLEIASDINDSGSIVGEGMTPGGEFHAFLLSPITKISASAALRLVAVPEPTSFALGATGVFGLALFSRRNVRRRGRMPAGKCVIQ